ncbi:hypothetical protein HH310_28620 [Actinoplanes sp. TBRC 11911]|nr:hypothetical protein [Actinoplanes sp. TBRC 11911]
MALDDTSFLACWGPIASSSDMNWYRQHIYLNLIVSHWQMEWEIGALSEAHLRFTAAGIFGGPLGRQFWAEAREPRRAVERGRRARTFYYIVDDEYQAALGRLEGEDSTGTQPEDNQQTHSDLPGSHGEQPRNWPVERTPQKGITLEFSRLTAAIYIAAGAVVGATVLRTLRDLTRKP